MTSVWRKKSLHLPSSYDVVKMHLERQQLKDKVMFLHLPTHYCSPDRTAARAFKIKHVTNTHKKARHSSIDAIGGMTCISQKGFFFFGTIKPCNYCSGYICLHYYLKQEGEKITWNSYRLEVINALIWTVQDSPVLLDPQSEAGSFLVSTVGRV